MEKLVWTNCKSIYSNQKLLFQVGLYVRMVVVVIVQIRTLSICQRMKYRIGMYDWNCRVGLWDENIKCNAIEWIYIRIGIMMLGDGWLLLIGRYHELEAKLKIKISKIYQVGDQTNVDRVKSSK